MSRALGNTQVSAMPLARAHKGEQHKTSQKQPYIKDKLCQQTNYIYLKFLRTLKKQKIQKKNKMKLPQNMAIKKMLVPIYLDVPNKKSHLN